jgi:hypothetical protein
LPDVTPPSQIDNGPMATTTYIPFFKRLVGPTQTIEPVGPALTLRYAVPSDTDAIDGLAQLDSARAARGVVPVAEVGGELWAGIRLDDHGVSRTRSSPPASSWRC